jgi:spermidine/putrescine transport system substrate-binding protein
MSKSLHSLGRRDFLGLSVVAGLAVAASPALVGCASGSSGDGQFNWLTWPNHFESTQVRAASERLGYTLNPVLFEDNAIGYQKVSSPGADFQSASADGLWVAKYHREGLIDSFDIASVKAAGDLYPIAREYGFWKAPDGYMAYPNAWSMSIIFYNPKYVTQAPDSWHALLKPEYRGKIVVPNAPSSILANAGVAVGAKEPTNMSAEELAEAKTYLQELKPNILKLAAQDSDVIRALADESAWIGIQWLGTEFRVKDAGGPVVKGVVPSEGTTGWIDGEMSVRKTGDVQRFGAFLDAMKTPENDAELFLKNGNPYLNEGAYKLLVDQGKKDLADLSLFNQPEKVLEMKLWGPSTNDQAYTDTFNEVFGA